MTTPEINMPRTRYRRVGVMTYEVSYDGENVGLVWRTYGGGWSARRTDGTLTVEDYPGSRAVAAGSLRSKAAR